MTHLAIAGGAYMLLLALVIVSNHGAHKIQAGGIVAGAVTTDKLAASSVTTAKLNVTEDMTVALLNAHLR